MDDRVFTGDTLLIRGTGRYDFQNGDADRRRTTACSTCSWRCPTRPLVYPAHDYRGLDGRAPSARSGACNPRLQVSSAGGVRGRHGPAALAQPGDDGRRAAGQPRVRSAGRLTPAPVPSSPRPGQPAHGVLSLGVQARIERTTLRTLLTVAIGVLGALALVAAVALVALTSLLERSAGEMAVAGRSVQRVEELEIALLGLDRAAPADRPRHAADLSRRLADLPVHLADDREAALYARVQRAVATYLAAGAAAESAGVFSALHELADLNARQASAAAERAASLHRIAVWLGASIAGLLLAGGAALIVWLRRRALAPLLHIREAIARYGRGDRAARAPEHGPAELADMARRFNQLAANLDRQHVAQLTFLAGVAHDLRNPLAALRSSADLLSIGRPTRPASAWRAS